ncbi:hypothetical protein [Campylobacter mucosalis]|uniref:hypothetical protein n=1 Tax=Campylobacter mucosalis TaxID=202 RepID=UPI00146FE222|nr:hypothetical protein [Campylobacter mucosalis]
MQQLLTELFTTFIVFMSIVIFAVYKSKREKSQNLKEFSDFFGVFGDSFIEICNNLAKDNKIKIINKNMSVSEFVSVLGVENFKTQIKSDEILDQKSISECVKALKEPLTLGIYALKDGDYYAFLLNKTELFVAINLANNLGESIIFCD